jgi:hypothetical protein
MDANVEVPSSSATKVLNDSFENGGSVVVDLKISKNQSIKGGERIQRRRSPLAISSLGSIWALSSVGSVLSEFPR